MIKFTAWPTDEGEWGIRLDIDVSIKIDLPPCPGMGGWKAAGDGSWWCNIHGEVATKLAERLLATRDGWYQYIEIVMDGDKLVSIQPN